jgi:hypothetical protein
LFFPLYLLHLLTVDGQAHTSSHFDSPGRTMPPRASSGEQANIGAGHVNRSVQEV